MRSEQEIRDKIEKISEQINSLHPNTNPKRLQLSAVRKNLKWVLNEQEEQ